MERMSISKGQVLQGKVTGITNFGAFIELENEQTGLVHISEIADTYVKDINDFLTVGDEVKVRVLSIDDNGKIGLSLRQEKEKKRPSRPSKPSVSFEDKLSRFMKDSDEKLASLNKNMNAKRRSGNRY